MQKSIIFANGAIKLFDPQLFGLKTLTGKLIFILHAAFCQVELPKASEPQRSPNPHDLDLCVLRSAWWDLSHLVWWDIPPAFRQRVCIWAGCLSLPVTSRVTCEDSRLVCLGVGWAHQVGVPNYLSPFTDHGGTWRTSFHLMPHVAQVRWIPPKGLTQMMDREAGQMHTHFNTVCVWDSPAVYLYM